MPERTFVTREVRLKQARQLAQARPSDTAAASLYSPDDGVHATVKKVIVCNTSGAAALYRLFHDDDGTTYDQTTALRYDKTVQANDFADVELDIDMANSSGNLAIRTSVNSALTFTAYGEEVQMRAR